MMKEDNLIRNIKRILNSDYIGDDCAYLPDLGIVITQDNLVENVHFRNDIINPHQLGYKSVMVNLSDIAASGAKPAYLTVGLSIPSKYNKEFIEEFYSGINFALKGLNVEVVGGDITSSEKIMISICAIGKTQNRKISSRSHAKPGYKIITSGEHGSSAAGLRILLNKLDPEKELIQSHLMPKAQIDFSKNISTQIKDNYAMMDSSDGLFDALFKIGTASNCTMLIDFEKILFNSKIKEYFTDYRDLIFYGGEDYQLIAAVPEEFIPNLNQYTIIGEVIEKEDCIIKLIDNTNTEKIYDISNKCFNHFE